MSPSSVADRLRAAGRGADQQAARRLRAAQRRLDGARGRAMALACGSADLAPRRRRAVQMASSLATSSLTEVVRRRQVAIACPAWAGSRRRRARGTERDLGVACRQRRGDQDRDVRALAQDQRQRGDAVELGHVEIEHDGVGIERVQLVERRPAVGGRADTSIEPCCDSQRETRPRTTTLVVDDHDAQRRLAEAGQRWGGRRAHVTAVEGASGVWLAENVALPRTQTSPTSWNFVVMISLSKGFMMYSSAPACMARAICATSFSVVQNTTLGILPCGISRSLRRNS